MKTKRLGSLQRTERGFELIEFNDRYGEPCSLQVSSSAEPSVWLGCERNSTDYDPSTGAALSPRMHLSRKQVEALVRHLSMWLENGSFE